MSAPALVVLADELGPRGRRKVAIATALSVLALGFVGFVAVGRLQATGQLDAVRWEPLTQAAVLRFLLAGLLNTLRAAATAAALALALGLVLALGRLSRNPITRHLSGAQVEFFRAVPLLLLILFAGFGLPLYGLRWGPFWFLVAALTAYNSAVLAEIFRAGILSLDRGQREAAEAVGMSYWQSMMVVLVPQAVRRMVPSIVAQLVTLLKDSSLGFVVNYDELLRRSRSSGEFFHNPLQTLAVVAVMYIAVNFSLGRVAAWLESRQRRRPRTAAEGLPPPTQVVDPI
ncbi:MAG TPA: amino acid ABC transporter permease [Acidimicrobiales bacterium]|nr:amino acid ABC transporter permease [Acidimicrobiales bacterium]